MKKIGVCLLVMAVLVGCGGSGGGGSESQTGGTGKSETSVNMTLKVPGASKISGAPNAYGITRIALTVSGAGMSPIHTDINPISGNQEDIIDLTVPSGAGRIFRAEAHDALGLAFVGATKEDLLGGSRDVFIVLERVPRVLGVSRADAMIGDTVKISGIAFGNEQGESTLKIGGIEASPLFDRGTVWSEMTPLVIPDWDGGLTINAGDAIRIVRWTDTEIIVTIPPGLKVGPAPVVVTVATETLVGDKVSGASLALTIVDVIHGVGGDLSTLATGNFDKFTLPIATPSVQIANVNSDSGASSSVALSSDGKSAVEAESSKTSGERIDNFSQPTPTVSTPLPVGRDIAVSHDGSVVLVADATTSLKLKVGGSPSVLVSPGASSTTLFMEVALSSDGRTAAVIGKLPSGAFQLFRIDGLPGSPVFTPLFSSTTGEVFTDVAVSADAETVIVGRHQGGKGGVERVIHFTSTADRTTHPSEKEMALNLPSTRVGVPPFINAVDVDISADGMTALANVSSDGSQTAREHYVFQVLDADLPRASIVNRFTNTCDTAGINCGGVFSGASLSSGGSIVLIRAPQFQRLDRYDRFNQNTSIGLTPQTSSSLNTDFIRTQDQIDLQ